MRFCTRCVYPEAAVSVVFDDEGVCSGCRVAEEMRALAERWRPYRGLALVYGYAELARRESPSPPGPHRSI